MLLQYCGQSSLTEGTSVSEVGLFLPQNTPEVLFRGGGNGTGDARNSVVGIFWFKRVPWKVLTVAALIYSGTMFSNTMCASAYSELNVQLHNILKMDNPVLSLKTHEIS